MPKGDELFNLGSSNSKGSDDEIDFGQFDDDEEPDFFKEFEEDEMDPDSREVDYKEVAKKEFMKAMKDTSADRLKKAVETAMPERFRAEYGDITEFASGISDSIDKNFGGLKKDVTALAKNIAKLAPEGKFKTWMQEKLKEQEDDYVARSENKEALMREEINNIFIASEASRQEQDAINNALADERAKKEETLQTFIAKDLRALRSFTFEQGVSYQKKNLEIKFKHLAIAKDHYDLAKATSTEMLRQLNSIAKNTSLPDLVKQRQMENISGDLKAKFRANLINRITGEQSFMGRLQKSATDKIAAYGEALKDKLMNAKDTTDEIISGKEELTEMADMMGGMENLKAQMKGKSAAGVMDFILAKTVLGSLLDKGARSKYGKKAISKVRNFMLDPSQPVRDMANKMLTSENGFVNYAGEFVSEIGDTLNVRNRQKSADLRREDLDSATGFDFRTKVNVNKVIPGYLRMILAETYANRIKLDPKKSSKHLEVHFDYSTEDFQTQKLAQANIIKKFKEETKKSTEYSRQRMEYLLGRGLDGKSLGITEKDKRDLANALMLASQTSGKNGLALLNDKDFQKVLPQHLKKKMTHIQKALEKEAQEDDYFHNDFTDSVTSLRQSVPSFNKYIEQLFKNNDISLLRNLGLVTYDASTDEYRPDANGIRKLMYKQFGLEMGSVDPRVSKEAAFIDRISRKTALSVKIGKKKAKKATKKAFNAVKDKVNVYREDPNQILRDVQNTGEAIGNYGRESVNKAKEMYGDTTQKAKDTYEQNKDKIDKVKETTKEKVDKVKETTKETVDKAKDVASTKAQGVYQEAKPKARDIYKEAKLQSKENFEKAKAAAEEIKDKLNPAQVEALKTLADQGVSKAEDILKTAGVKYDATEARIRKMEAEYKKEQARESIAKTKDVASAVEAIEKAKVTNDMNVLNEAVNSIQSLGQDVASNPSVQQAVNGARKYINQSIKTGTDAMNIIKKEKDPQKALKKFADMKDTIGKFLPSGTSNNYLIKGMSFYIGTLWKLEKWLWRNVYGKVAKGAIKGVGKLAKLPFKALGFGLDTARQLPSVLPGDYFSTIAKAPFRLAGGIGGYVGGGVARNIGRLLGFKPKKKDKSKEGKEGYFGKLKGLFGGSDKDKAKETKSEEGWVDTRTNSILGNKPKKPKYVNGRLEGVGPKDASAKKPNPILSFLKSWGGKLLALLGPLGAFFSKFSIGGLSGMIGKAFMGATKMIGKGVYGLFKGGFNLIKTIFTEGPMAALSKGASAVGGAIKKGVGAVGSLVGGLWNKGTELVKGAGKAIGKGLSTVADVTKKFLFEGFSKCRQLYDFVTEGLYKKVVQGAKGAFEGAKTQIGRVVKSPKIQGKIIKKLMSKMGGLLLPGIGLGLLAWDIGNVIYYMVKEKKELGSAICLQFIGFDPWDETTEVKVGDDVLTPEEQQELAQDQANKDIKDTPATKPKVDTKTESKPKEEKPKDRLKEDNTLKVSKPRVASVPTPKEAPKIEPEPKVETKPKTKVESKPTTLKLTRSGDPIPPKEELPKANPDKEKMKKEYAKFLNAYGKQMDLTKEDIDTLMTYGEMKSQFNNDYQDLGRFRKGLGGNVGAFSTSHEVLGKAADMLGVKRDPSSVQVQAFGAVLDYARKKSKILQMTEGKKPTYEDLDKILGLDSTRTTQVYARAMNEIEQKAKKEYREGLQNEINKGNNDNLKTNKTLDNVAKNIASGNKSNAEGMGRQAALTEDTNKGIARTNELLEAMVKTLENQNSGKTVNGNDPNTNRNSGVEYSRAAKPGVPLR